VEPARVAGRQLGEVAVGLGAVRLALGEADLLLAELDVPRVVEAAVERLLSYGRTCQYTVNG
jgi:hypothetical protein